MPQFLTRCAVLLGAVALLNACAMGPGLFGASQADRLERHVARLSSDAFEGRGTGTEGFEKAAAYVARNFARYGVEPALPDYRQPVPLLAIDPDSVDGALSLVVGGSSLKLEPGEDVGFFPPSDGRAPGLVAEASGPLVFVGDGVVAPSLGLRPYEGVDVRGKIVVMVRGAMPISDRATEVHVQRFDVKRAEAARRGARGVILIDPEDRDVTRLTRLRGGHPDGSLYLGAGLGRPMPAAVVSHEAIRPLFAASGKNLDDILDAARKGEAPSFAMAGAATLATSASAKAVPAFNVVGVVPGNDPELSAEAVVVTAHLDHLGMRQPRNGNPVDEDGQPVDLIYNGALDNATGTAIIMEAARRLAEAGGSARSVIFAAVTAEEAGLLGSAHLARNIEALGYAPVANVNIDMPVLTYPLNDIIGFGEGYSSLAEPLRAAAAEVGLVATPDPLPELSLFVRSDHYRFVQEGIPALFLFNGMSGEGAERFQEFMRTHYHRPSDEVSLPINWDDAATLTDLTLDLVTRIADEPERPRWNPGVVFDPGVQAG